MAASKGRMPGVKIQVTNLRELLDKLDADRLLSPLGKAVKAIGDVAEQNVQATVPKGKTGQLASHIQTEVKPPSGPHVAPIVTISSNIPDKRDTVLEYGNRAGTIKERRWMRKAARRTASVVRRYLKEAGDGIERIWAK